MYNLCVCVCLYMLSIFATRKRVKMCTRSYGSNGTNEISYIRHRWARLCIRTRQKCTKSLLYTAVQNGYRLYTMTRHRYNTTRTKMIGNNGQFFFWGDNWTKICIRSREKVQDIFSSSSLVYICTLLYNRYRRGRRRMRHTIEFILHLRPFCSCMSFWMIA